MLVFARRFNTKELRVYSVEVTDDLSPAQKVEMAREIAADALKPARARVFVLIGKENV